MTFRITYGQLRVYGTRLEVDLANAGQLSGSIAIAEKRWRKAIRNDPLAQVMVYEGPGSPGVETRERYCQVTKTPIPQPLALAYLRLRMEVTRENGFEITPRFSIGGPGKH